MITGIALKKVKESLRSKNIAIIWKIFRMKNVKDSPELYLKLMFYY